MKVKKNYKTPVMLEVELLTNASLMNILEGSTTTAGTGNGYARPEDEEGVGRSRGQWGSLW